MHRPGRRITHSDAYQWTINKTWFKNCITLINFLCNRYSYKIYTKRIVYVRIDAKRKQYSSRGVREAHLKLPKKEDAMEDPCNVTLLSNPSARKEKNFPFSEIWIKPGLVIHIDNTIRPTYTISIPFALKYKRYYTYKRSLTRVKWFADEITY